MLNYETLIADYEIHYNKNPKSLALTLLQTGTAHSGIDLLAHMATAGAMSAAEIGSAFREGRPPNLAEVNTRALAWFALVVGVRVDAPDSELANLILQHLVDVGGIRKLPEQAARVFLQLRLEAEPDVVRRYLSDSRVRRPDKEILGLDARNPYLFPKAGLSEQAWLKATSKFLDPNGKTPLALLPGDGAPFYRLTAHTDRVVKDGPKITVVTSAYNPDKALLTATRSVIEQTWQNWEMLIIDDASPAPDAETYLAAAQALDPRVRVIRKAVNGGTYLARNTALVQARGEFVTFLDSDDWAHPNRLERGIAPLLRNRSLSASYSLGTRVTENLKFTRVFRLNRGPSANSLMFRISDVVNEIGFFDTVRKAADNEYLNRIIAVFGEESIKRVESIGTVSLDGETLSASDFHAGWRHAARTLYRTSYAVVQDQKIDAGRTLYIDNGQPTPHIGIDLWQRPGDVNYRRRGPLDVVVAGDWYSAGGPQNSMLAEIRALLSAGFSVGVTDLRPLRAGMVRNQELNAELLELLESRQIEYVFPEEERHVGLLLLRYPPLMQFPSIQTTNLTVERFIIVANQAPSEPDGTDQRYIPAEVDAQSERIIGVKPLWVAQGPTIREILQEHADSIDLAEWNLPTIAEEIATSGWVPRQKRVVVGRHSRDDDIKFPADPRDLFKSYGFPADYKVLMLGAEIAAKRACEAVGRHVVPDNWEVLPVREIPVEEFLSEIDVFVYFDNEEANEAFCRVILEAAAAGKLVITSRKHEETFGDAVVYATPDTSVQVVEEYLADRELFAHQTELALRRVRENWSPQAFITAIAPSRISKASILVEASDAKYGKEKISITRESRRRPARVRNASELVAASIPLRTKSDAQICDSLIVLADQNAQDVEILALELRSQIEREAAISLGSLQSEGIVAIVKHIDGQWHVEAPHEWQIEAHSSTELILGTA